jgi:hypothetical protein
MLEWKVRVLTLLIPLIGVLDQLFIHVDHNWNW